MVIKRGPKSTRGEMTRNEDECPVILRPRNNGEGERTGANVQCKFWNNAASGINERRQRDIC